MTIDAQEPSSSRQASGVRNSVDRLSLVAMAAATVLFHLRPNASASPVPFDPYRKAESILKARGFAPDGSAPSLGLATRVVSYSTDQCPRGVVLAALSYDQLGIVLDRIPPDSAKSYLVVAPYWEKRRLDRVGLFFAGVSCRLREPSGSTRGECESYLHITHLPGCLHPEDWHGFWRAP